MPDYIEELNESQRAAVLYGDGPSLVIAGAGSGKTRVLTYKIAYLLENGYNPWNILALTFTNKAAREMKERIARQVGEQRARFLWMGTFHSVFSRILRAEASHIGFTSQFTIYDSADSKSLTIGTGTNVQDNCVIHVDKGYSVTVGKNVTIGHSAIVHGCSVGDNTLIGMGAIILNGASVGKNCIVGAGALVTQNMQIPEGSLVYGSPAKIIRSVTEAEITSNLENAAHYVREGQEYAKHLGKGNESHEG